MSDVLICLRCYYVLVDKEDVVTKGGRVAEALSVLSEFECKVIGVTSLVDRSTGTIDFGVPFKPLMRLEFPTIRGTQAPDDCRVPV